MIQKQANKNNDTDSTYKAVVFRGKQVFAKYNDPGLEKYRGNPAIEALPAILDEDSFLEKATYFPPYSQEDRKLPTHLRIHQILSAAEFFQPLAMHIHLEQKISTVLRAGYRSRNPAHNEFWEAIDQKVAKSGQPTDDKYGTSDEKFKEQLHSTRSSALSVAFLGISGIGKTSGLKTILSMYPQVILHKNYNGKKFSHRQLVWLIVECPHNGSIKQLCINFLQAVDSILDTNYERSYGQNGRASEPTLVAAMARVAAAHSLGLLIIDEINNLRVARGGGDEKMLNFFVSLTNVVGIPVLPVGTPKAAQLFTGALRMARRGSGQGDVIWNALKNDGNWELFLESLWRYQYTKKETPLTPDLIDVIHDETQGIIDFAVKIYMLAQIRAITTGTECLDETLIRSVAIDSLQMAQPMLDALRSGNIDKIKEFDDVERIDLSVWVDISLQKLADEKLKSFHSQQEAKPHEQHSKNNKNETEKKQSVVYLKGGVNSAFVRANDEERDVYDILGELGLIKSGLEYWS